MKKEERNDDEENLVINIDINLLDKLGLTPTQYVLAYYIHHKDKVRFTNLRQMYADSFFKEDLYSLIIKGYISSENKEDKFKFVFDNSTIIGIFDDIKEEVKEEELPWETFVKEFRAAFPSGIKSGGFYVKSSERDIDNKLRKFVKEYNYSQDTILEAVNSYVESSSLKGYQFMKVAHYFIFKNDESMLASYCDEIDENGLNSSSISSIFTDKL